MTFIVSVTMFVGMRIIEENSRGFKFGKQLVGLIVGVKTCDTLTIASKQKTKKSQVFTPR